MAQAPDLEFVRGVVDVMATGTTTIGTLEVPGASESFNTRFHPVLIVVSVAQAAVGLITLPVFSVGYSNPNYDDFLGGTTLATGVASLDEQMVRLVKDDSASVGDATNVVVNVTTAATATSGTLKLKFMVFGMTDPRA